MQSSKVYAENRLKCEDIIRKVRNFNEFLNEVKKKLKTETTESMSDYWNNSFQHSSLEADSKEVVMSIRLESERIEL